MRWGIVAVFTVIVFWLLSRQVDFGEVKQTLSGAHIPTLAFGASFTFLFPVFSSLRWRRMLQALGHEVPFRDCFDMIMAAWPMGTITPSKTGDFVKAYYLKDRAPVRVVLGSVLAERTLDVLVLLALAVMGCVFFQRWGLALIAGAALLGGLLAILVLLRFRLPIPRKLKEKLAGVLGSLRLLARTPALLGVVILYTVLNWSCSIAQLVLCYRALGVEVPMIFAAGALPLAIFVGLLPLTLSGMGTRDAALISLFAPYATSEVSLGVGLLYSLFGYWLPALAGVPFMRRALPK